MEYIEFGKNKTKVSQLLVGLMRIPALSDADLEKFIDTALDNGINGLDIADCYSDGVCESKLGDLYQRRPDLREKTWLQTKCGIVRATGYKYFDFSKKHILEAAEASLKRLRTDHVDSFLLHRPDALMEPDEICEAFMKLHAEGKVLDFGVSNFNPLMMEKVQRALPFKIACNQVQLSVCHTPMIDAGFQVNMTWNGASMRDGGILEYCQMHDIALQAWSPMQYGYFEGIFVGSDKYPKLNGVLNRIAGERGVTPTAVALAWILRYPLRMQVVTGTTKVQRLLDSAACADVKLSRAEWYELYIAAGNELP